jgi:UDPglucose--hexose-1-phosphate uridylyltransferase
MNELRKDYILDRYVIVAAARATRPDQFKREEESKHSDICYFCPGNEHLTPAEIGRLQDNNGWYVRWFENKFAAVKQEGSFELKLGDNFFLSGTAFGKHEVIVESPQHNDELSYLSESHIMEILKVYSHRIEELAKMPGIRYVQVFKNHLHDAGTSLVHTHSQVVAYNLIPASLQQKLNAISRHSSCPHCKIIEIESRSARTAFLGKNFVAFCPFASRFLYEVWVVPKRHVRRMSEFNDDELLDLASMLKLILVKLKQLNAPYNLVINYSPNGTDMHFHIEVMPRLATWAGFELGTETTINPVAPEHAAEFYRS